MCVAEFTFWKKNEDATSGARDVESGFKYVTNLDFAISELTKADIQLKHFVQNGDWLKTGRPAKNKSIVNECFKSKTIDELEYEDFRPVFEIST